MNKLPAVALVLLTLVSARDRAGNLLAAGRRVTGVADKQIREFGIDLTAHSMVGVLHERG